MATIASSTRVPRQVPKLLTVRSCKGSQRIVPSVIWRFKREVTCPGCSSTVGLVQDDRVFDRRVFRIAAHCKWALQSSLRVAERPPQDSSTPADDQPTLEVIPVLAGNPYGFPYPPGYEADFTDCPF